MSANPNQQNLERQVHLIDITTQKTLAKKFLDLSVEGRTWYVLDYRWWKKWNDFTDAVVEGDSLDVALDDFPGRINNSNLLVDNKLKPDLLREEDFTVIPDDLWNLLVDYYKCDHEDTTVFQRKAISTPSGRWVVEIYPPCFAFRELKTDRLGFEGVYSESQTIGVLKSIIKKELHLTGHIRLYFRDNDQEPEELTDDDVTIGEASLERNKTLYYYVDNAVDQPKSNSAGSHQSMFSKIGNYWSSPSTHEPGVCGLSNLGNTCFMNSAIQCMSNVPELTAYFTSKRWEDELNYENPLGACGRIAKAYADLIGHMWSGQYAYDVPRTLKREIALIANQFHGYAQHDIHELLLFLLDGLHEDLNRVLKKPYVQFDDAGDKPDPQLAKESWEYHKARNDSVIVDYFHSLLKSTVICRTCNYRSATFDPIASLNLPLSQPYRNYQTIFVWPWSGGGAQGMQLERYDLPVPDEVYVEDVIENLQNERPLQDTCQYHLSDMYSNSIKPFHSTHRIRDRSTPLIAYELPQGQLIPVRLYQPGSPNPSRWIPFYLSISPDLQSHITQSDLIRAVASRLSAIGIHSIASNGTEWLSALDGTVDGNVTAQRSDPHVSPMEQDQQTDEWKELLDSLRDRIQLTDQFSHPVDLTTQIPVDLRKPDSVGQTDVCHVLSLDCTGLSSLQTRMDGMMQSLREQSRHAPYKKYPAITLLDCFEKFVATEKLSAKDLWYCSRCKELKQVTKKFDLWSLPKILVIQLKRFRANFRSRDKIDDLVKFPTRGLDLSKWVVNNSVGPCIYDLIAVSNHMGYLGGGHYTAYALNSQTQKWHLFDDASTREVSESSVVSSAAYVLVYRRRDTTSNQSNSNGQAVGIDDALCDVD